MEITFSGQKALVTGAGRGIGRETAKMLSKCGATTYALSRTEEHLKTLVEECPTIVPVVCDLSNWDRTREIVSSLGPIDLLVNNAAVGSLSPFVDAAKEDLDKAFAVNFYAVVNVSQIVAKRMIADKKRGSIVNISSQASLVALKDHGVYSSTKGALDALTKSMALELGPHGIRVNSVNPTVVLTEMGLKSWSDPVKAGGMLNRIPLKKFAEVEDVVNSIIFLLSDKANSTTGSLHLVDGGALCC
ncbi:D-erythrulose reductase [Octopus bimaculoides]|uniref:L-xylulose reductase n=1 Tax=Octopus bimaculoides TaxID=37653 RepID=A0A0L8HT09_OCTBM|nr:D-erythrulose reductase [Octopus bimaculoides]|eukprot:XP_014769651.1 PREDICTED: D-erythrulose reductase-like [Octopus bimaculoides]